MDIETLKTLAATPPPAPRWRSLAASLPLGKNYAANGIVSNVSVITSGVECVGHSLYTDRTTLAQVKCCADAMQSIQVKAGHSSGFSGIVGVLKNFRIDDNDKSAQLRADLHLLKSHPAFSQISEMCETMPEVFGLSIAFSGEPEAIDGLDFARCTKLYSVDLVDHPAANPNGLFSANKSQMNIINLTQWMAMSADNQKSFCMNGGKVSREAFLSMTNHAQSFFLSAGGHIAKPVVPPGLPKTKTPPANSMWIKTFLQLKPTEQTAHFAKGGKVHD